MDVNVDIKEHDININNDSIEITIDDKTSQDITIQNAENNISVEQKVNEIVFGEAIGSSVSPFVEQYLFRDFDDSEENTIYVGREKKNGDWLIIKADLNTISILGASKKNNTQSTYQDAWNNRTTLNYDYLKEVV